MAASPVKETTGNRIGAGKPGPGRPKGSLNRFSEKAIRKAESGGLMPLDYMLSVMRSDATADDVRLDAAKAAAPYVHHRLQAIDANITGQITIGDVLDALADG